MSPYAVIDLALVAVLATTVLALLFSRRKPKPAEYGRDDGQTDVQPPSLTDLDGPFRRAAENVRKHPPVEAKYHPRPTSRKPTILLTPRQIERVNTQRKLRGAPCLNRKGLATAIAYPTPAREQPQTPNNWLAYLVAYEVLSPSHQTPYIGGHGSLTIDPNLPYNGHGGDYGGAGASGDWANNYIVTDSPPTVSDSSVTYSSSPDIGSSPDISPN
jgi:hypothetical protein